MPRLLHGSCTMQLWWGHDLARFTKMPERRQQKPNSLLVCTTWLRATLGKWNRHNRMMPSLRSTRKRVAPLARMSPRHELCQNHEVAAEVVAHCETSCKQLQQRPVAHCEGWTGPRVPALTVVEITQDIDTNKPCSFGLPEQPEENHPIPTTACHCGNAGTGVTWRNYVCVISHGWGNTLRRIMMKSNRKPKKSKREGNHKYSLI